MFSPVETTSEPALGSDGSFIPATASRGDPSPASSIRFESVTVRYGRHPALVDLRLDLRAGEALALLGPSGSGKTTVLRALAGFTPIDSGRIVMRGRDVAGLPPQRRGLGIVVQSYALFPHMSVAENVAFGLRARRTPRASADRSVADCLGLVGMSGYAHRRPHELSGGQQQRVALARALAIRPDVLLLDEPLSALDAPLRREMLAELIRLHRHLPDLTMLLVTHDQSEALALADRIGLLFDGRLRALDTPQRLYNRPPNRLAAEFLGQANLLAAQIVPHSNGDGTVRVSVGEQILRLRPPQLDGAGSRLWLCIRPHQLSLAPQGLEDGWPCSLTGIVLGCEWKGSHYRVTVDVEGQTVNLEVSAASRPRAAGSVVTLWFSSEAAWLLPVEG